MTQSRNRALLDEGPVLAAHFHWQSFLLKKTYRKRSVKVTLPLSDYVLVMQVLARTTPSAKLCLGFTFPTSLWTLIVSTTASLRQDACILDFAVELFQCKLK
jgi:hypothetical protein